MESNNATSAMAPYTAGSIAEEHGVPPEAVQKAAKAVSPRGGFFGVYIDPRTWGAFFYMLLSLVTGVLYFTWGVTGFALAVSFLILIIGLPFAALFVLSVRGLGILEARFAAALLGTRITPGPIYPAAGSNWLQRLKAAVTDKRTWLALLYLVLQMPLGVIYFSMVIILISLALATMAAPILQFIGDMPVVTVLNGRLLLPVWAMVLMEAVGFVLLTLTLHLVRLVGRLHGRYAKALLGA